MMPKDVAKVRKAVRRIWNQRASLWNGFLEAPFLFTRLQTPRPRAFREAIQQQHLGAKHTLSPHCCLQT